MKVKLSQENGIATLEVIEEVNMTEVAALKAGIVKFLQSGKNKIILNLLKAKPLPIEAIQECFKLNSVASELKGSIVVVGQGDLIVKASEGAKDGGMKCFNALDAAMRFFQDKTADEKKALDAVGADEELRKRVTQLEQENVTLQGKVKNADPQELKKLKEENGNLKTRIEVMEKQIRTMTQEQKRPFEAEALRSQVEQLEKTLAENFASPPKKPA